jgi:hypothetical protein
MMRRHPWAYALLAFAMAGVMQFANIIGDLVAGLGYPDDIASAYLSSYGFREWSLVGWSFAAAIILLVVFVRSVNAANENGAPHGSR